VCVPASPLKTVTSVVWREKASGALDCDQIDKERQATPAQHTSGALAVESALMRENEERVTFPVCCACLVPTPLWHALATQMRFQ
jgi:hypothetical protein